MAIEALHKPIAGIIPPAIGKLLKFRRPKHVLVGRKQNEPPIMPIEVVRIPIDDIIPPAIGFNNGQHTNIIN
jgi:hypothetical protein